MKTLRLINKVSRLGHRRNFSSFLESYNKLKLERDRDGIPPKPLNAQQAAELIEQLKSPEENEKDTLLYLLENRIPPGVDEAAYIKAAFLSDVAASKTTCPIITPIQSTKLLGTMVGGYNIEPLVSLLDEDKSIAEVAANGLKHTLLMFDSFYDVTAKAENGNKYALEVIKSWADAEWFLARPVVPEKITIKAFKVPGEINTDDLSPAPDAWSRPDIPLHAKAFLKVPRENVHDALTQLTEMRESVKGTNIKLAFVGDVVGTGSSRKSATNSVLWHMGEDIPFVPNKKIGGVCIGGKIAPIFYNTMEDSGALPLEMDVSGIKMGDILDIFPYEGIVKSSGTDLVVSRFNLKSEVLLDEVQAGGRIPLIIGKGLTDKANDYLSRSKSVAFRSMVDKIHLSGGYTLAQKMVGKACGVEGVLPGQYCEPKMTTVGSQDTTGPMTRDELKDLACLGFQADLVMQSFCHTAAYPKPVDVITHHTLPAFMKTRGGVSLKPGDGIIHSWLNRMLLPDTVGTGGDSHTRFPIGISFPAGSGLVAFAAATGVMPLDMPESVLVRFHGTMQPGITLRDLVHAIPYFAIKQNLLTIDKASKKNVFSGRILEIEGLPHLKCEQAFELSDASAERSAAGCTIKLSEEPIIEYLQSNVVMLKWMISEGYGDERTIVRRIKEMENWIANPVLMEADQSAKYVATLDIDLDELKEPVLCAPNDPDDARLLSEVTGEKVDEVFIGSCMTNIGHFRAAGKILASQSGEINTRLWIAPPTKMDQAQLTEEGYYATYGNVGARIEMPGCSLCMGNQARVKEKSTVVSTSTRNFPNRLGNGANVYLASAELAALASILGRLPSVEEYFHTMQNIEESANDTYRYLNFNEIESFNKAASEVSLTS